MKLTKQTLSKLIREEISKVEGNARIDESSVDAQIDSMLVQFEGQAVSIPNEANESHRYSLRILLEEPSDEVPEDGETPPNAPPDQNASAEADPQVPPEAEKSPIDVDQFGRRVARLVENYENLLDIRTAIMSRARKFLEENYGPEQATELDDVLDRQYGLAIEPKDNTPNAPAAVGAGPEV